MRNLEQDEKDPIKILIQESGLESPKDGFHLNVLNKLSSLPSVNVYEPVISYFTMKIIGGTLIAFFVSVLIFVPSSESSISVWNQLPNFSLPNLKLSIPTLAIPKKQLDPIFNFSLLIFSLLAFGSTLLASKKWKYQ